MVERQRNPSSTAPWLQGQTILLRVLKSLSLPLRAHQRHDQLVPMDAAKKSVAAPNPLFLEADVLIGSARAVVLRENAQPEAPGVGLPKCGVDDLAQQQPAVATARATDRDPLHQGDALRGPPITQNGEPDRFRARPADEIGMPAVGKSGAVLRLTPTADQSLESWQPLGRHDERDDRFVATCDAKRLGTC